VGSDTEMTPRRPIYPVPYAWSLRPGAYITDTMSFPSAILKVENGGSGRAIWATTAGHTALEGWNSNPSSGVGVWGGSAGTGGFGVFGYASATSGTNYGAAGQSESTTGFGVHGYNANGTGVAGFQSGYGLADLGGYWKPGGLFGGRNGVVGITKATSGYGVFGWDKSSGGGAGIIGRTESSGGWAGYFWSSAGNGVYISAPAGKTGLNVASGSKSAVVRTNDGSRLLYTEESTEVWFTDYGFGKLQNGAAVVTIDPLFAQTVNLNEPYHVFVQAYGNASLYVTNRTPTSFEVRLHDGDPNVEFSYRIVAKRLGYEDQRLERAPWADNDPNLYPEKRATWEAQGGEP